MRLLVKSLFLTSGNKQTETKNVKTKQTKKRNIFGKMETIKDTAFTTQQGFPIPTYVLDDLCR